MRSILGRLALILPLFLVATAVTPWLFADECAPQGEKQPKLTREPFSSELRREWLDIRGLPPTENQVAVAALCWAVKEQMRDKPFTPWLSEKRIQVDWPLDERFEKFAALDLFGVLPQGITDDHLQHAWLDLYGLVLTEKTKEKAALNWIRLRQSQPGSANTPFNEWTDAIIRVRR